MLLPLLSQGSDTANCTLFAAGNPADVAACPAPSCQRQAAEKHELKFHSCSGPDEHGHRRRKRKSPTEGMTMITEPVARPQQMMQPVSRLGGRLFNALHHWGGLDMDLEPHASPPLH